MKRSSHFFRAVLALTAAAALLAGVSLEARQRKPRGSSSRGFAYYMLVLSYAPDFCDQPRGVKDARECGAGRHVGFVVHGLWPQGENSRGPENCGSASPVSQSLVAVMLNYFPTASLIQHEWTSHGTCTGLSQSDYFALVRKARDSVQLPADLKGPNSRLNFSPAAIEARLAAANPSFSSAAFRTSCYQDHELEEIRVCMNKDLSTRACGASAGECQSSGVTLLPER